MAQRVVYSDEALADIYRIVEFNDLRNQSDTYSKKFVAGLSTRLAKLSHQPFSGKKTSNPDILLLIWDYYYIFYKPDKDKIQVARVYHQKENVAL